MSIKIDEKKCTKCSKTKPLDSFGTDKRGIAGKRSECKVCHYNMMIRSLKKKIKEEEKNAGKRRTKAVRN